MRHDRILNILARDPFAAAFDYIDNLTKAEILDHLKARFDKMYLPDDVVFIEAVPKTSVGKFDKKVLRVQYKDYQLPEA
jgi:fatty-acyl-CoA synthase